MTVKDLETLFDYSCWANRKPFAVISQLTGEQFTEPVAGSYGSVRNTLVHMMSAEWGWLERSGGPPRGPALTASDYPALASILERWQHVEASVRDFLGSLRAEDLDRTIEFAFGGPAQTVRLSEAMHHAFVHGAHHRGQLALLLRSLGYVPGNFDILFYYARPVGSN